MSVYKCKGFFTFFTCIVQLSCDCHVISHRLQYFARNCQAYHCSLQAAVKSAGSVEIKDEQVRRGGRHQPTCHSRFMSDLSLSLPLSLSLSLSQAKLRSVALKITANINVLIRVSALVPFQFLHSFILLIPHSRTSSTTPHLTRRR